VMVFANVTPVWSGPRSLNTALSLFPVQPDNKRREARNEALVLFFNAFSCCSFRGHPRYSVVNKSC
jgi:hypothetical protein